METNLQNIQKLIVDSELSKEMQDDFVALLTLVPDTELDSMAKLLSEDKDWVSRIYQNIKAKQSALATGGQVSWSKIIQEEEVQLKDLES